MYQNFWGFSNRFPYLKHEHYDSVVQILKRNQQMLVKYRKLKIRNKKNLPPKVLFYEQGGGWKLKRAQYWAVSVIISIPFQDLAGLSP